MSEKSIIYLGLLVGSTIGGYLPSLFGISIFSFWSIVTSALGGALGIYLTYQWINSS